MIHKSIKAQSKCVQIHNYIITQAEVQNTPIKNPAD